MPPHGLIIRIKSLNIHKALGTAPGIDIYRKRKREQFTIEGKHEV